MKPEDYDAWYRTPRGSWIGETEYKLLRLLLQAAGGRSMIDVGCGTGYFTRRFAMDGALVTGIDPNPAMVGYAQSYRAADEHYVRGDARSLPFPDQFFDYCVSVTSLCFIKEQELAVSEMVRVTRGRVALGLLNRNSLLYQEKGRNAGSGTYKGAHWHTPTEARRLLEGFPVTNITVRSAIYLPNGGRLARAMEKRLPNRLLWGGFLVVAGDIT